MTDIAIRVENLSKRDPSTRLRAGRIGAKRQRYERFTETVTEAVKAPIRRLSSIVRHPSSIVHRPTATTDHAGAILA